MAELILILIAIVIIILLIPTDSDLVKDRLTSSGYQYIYISYKKSPWHYVAYVNHINLKERSRVRVFSCIGYFKIKVI
jgi:hypothetical protein